MLAPSFGCPRTVIVEVLASAGIHSVKMDNKLLETRIWPIQRTVGMQINFLESKFVRAPQFIMNIVHIIVGEFIVYIPKLYEVTKNDTAAKSRAYV